MVRITEALVRKRAEHNECLISTLEELSLHQEDIECIENLQNWCRDLKILLLQSNLISEIANLNKLKRLEYLNLAVNNIERVANLEALESLQKLDLTLNFIGELTSIESLRGNYNLRELILTGNPCSDYEHYRDYVLATLPQLATFDCEAITETERLKVLPFLGQYRAGIVQRQATYAIERDAQKIRFLEQKAELQAKMASIEDDDERIKAFWDAKSEHCPEIRTEIAYYHKMGRHREQQSADQMDKRHRRQPKLFAPCGRPYNVNQAKLPFRFQDERDEYRLELKVFRHLATSLIDVDLEMNYIRVAIKGKIFQITFNEEVKIGAATVQRSQITGELLVKLPKLHVADDSRLMSPNANKDSKATVEANMTKSVDFNTCPPVDIKGICASVEQDEVPDLI